MSEWTPESRLRSWKANGKLHDGFGLAQVIEDYENLLRTHNAALALETQRRVEAGLKAGQLLGPDFDGASLVQVAEEVVRLRAALALETQRRLEAEQARDEAQAEARMGHVRLDECADGVETKGKPLYDHRSHLNR